MISSKEIHVEGGSSHVLSKLNSQRSSTKYCDVVLQVGDDEFPAHRAVLAACSEYFDAMFSSQMKERHERNISMKGIASDAMEKILDFFYSDIIILTDENVGDLLQAASLLNLLALKPTTCLHFRNLGRLYALENIVKQAECGLKENFEAVSLHLDFCQLSVTELKNLLSSDDIRVEYESNIFVALVRWVNYDPEKRSKYFTNLFKCIRLQLIPTEYLAEKVRKEPLVRACLECRDLVEDAFLFQVNPNRFKTQNLREGQIIFADVKSNFVLCFGGAKMSVCNVCDGKWEVLSIPGQSDFSASSPVVCGRATVFCGGPQSSPSNRVSRFNGRMFESFVPMKTPRANAATVCLRGDILVFGGELSEHVMYQGRVPNQSYSRLGTQVGVQQIDSGCKVLANDFERYDSTQKQWEVVGKLLQPRAAAAAVVVKSYVYLLGGYNRVQDMGSNRNPRGQKLVCDVVEKYDSTANKWSSAKNMTQARASFGAAALNNIIYCVGGHDQNLAQLASSEFFDTTTEQWTNFIIPNPWKGPSSACNNGDKIYAFGCSTPSLYTLDATEHKWNIISSNESLTTCQKIVPVYWKQI
ncbi:kelch-like protein 12 isoform X2 [Clavelina lepadiformis]|uniref:kelch-like protein 12 isoform X2 n=1 Tax=Clavelina lepadiformis TaxID=159417 RepID=UPI004043390F